MLNLVGHVFGRWTARERDTSSKRPRWICECTCGTVASVRQSGLRDGTSQSCGCKHREELTERMTAVGPTFKHGQARAGKHTKEYWIWMQMRKRCSDPKQEHFHLYGGRGITVCDRWLSSFENFIADLGPRPTPKHSIERVDSNGTYEPGNCRWATPKEQANNTSRNKFIEWNGQRKTAAQWAEELGVNSELILYRLENGWTVEEAFFTKKFGLRKKTHG